MQGLWRARLPAMRGPTCGLTPLCCAALRLLRPARLQAAKRFEAGVAAIPGLEVIGAPEMSVVAFKSTEPKVRVPSRTCNSCRVQGLPSVLIASLDIWLEQRWSWPGGP